MLLFFCNLAVAKSSTILDRWCMIYFVSGSWMYFSRCCSSAAVCLMVLCWACICRWVYVLQHHVLIKYLMLPFRSPPVIWRPCTPFLWIIHRTHNQKHAGVNLAFSKNERRNFSELFYPKHSTVCWYFTKSCTIMYTITEKKKSFTYKGWL